jgi:acetyl esterase
VTTQEKTRQLDPHFDAMLEAAKAIEMPPMAMIPAPMVRDMYRAQRSGLDAGAPKDLEVRDLEVAGGAGPLKARLYVAKDAPAVSGCLVYFHGGGFVIGDLETHDDFLRRLTAASGLRTLAVDYRLAPEHPFPAAHDDALAATKWVIDHAAEIGADPKKIAVGGCSAGGNLAACLAVELKNDPAHQLAFQLLLYPATAMEQDTQSRKDLATGYVLTAEVMEWFGNHFGAAKHPEGSRAEPKNADVTGVAPALVITAGFDPLKDEGKAYAAQLNAAGVKATHIEYPSFVHDFMIMASVSPAVIPAIEDTAKALKAAIG